MLALRSAKISGASSVYSCPVHFVLRRQESILLPQTVVESDAHFVKFVPHFSVIQSRSALSHAFAAVVGDFGSSVVFVCSASNIARWRRIVSANALPDESVVLAPISDNTVLNRDVLLSTTMASVLLVVAAFVIPPVAIIAIIEQP